MTVVQRKSEFRQRWWFRKTNSKVLMLFLCFLSMNSCSCNSFVICVGVFNPNHDAPSHSVWYSTSRRRRKALIFTKYDTVWRLTIYLVANQLCHYKCTRTWFIWRNDIHGSTLCIDHFMVLCHHLTKINWLEKIFNDFEPTSYTNHNSNHYFFLVYMAL